MAAEAGEMIDVTGFTCSLAALDLTSLGDDVLADLVVDLELLLNAVHGTCAAGLEEFERRGAWKADGALSGSGWLAARTTTAKPVLRLRVRSGAVLRQLPSAAGPAREGRLSPDHLASLAGCARRHPVLAERDEALLVGQALELDAGAFRAVARHWEGCAADVDSPDPADLPGLGPEPVDELYLSKTLNGRYQLTGSFSAETGDLVSAALDGEVDRALRARRDGDPSIAPLPSQLRAAALVDLLGQTMRREPSERSVPDRYRAAAVFPAGHHGDRGVAGCDADTYPVWLDTEGEVLDIGRDQRRWTTAIRRAITFRDRGCVFPTCDRPPSWADVHHCQPWEHGGHTKADNGALLCRHHHTFVHRYRWTITVEHHQAITRRPDGSIFTPTRWDTTPPTQARAG